MAKEILTVEGVKSFKGMVEGRAYDSTTLLVKTPFDPSNKDTQVGCDNEAITFGTSDNFVMFKGKQYPLTVEVELMRTMKGLSAVSVNIVSQSK